MQCFLQTRSELEQRTPQIWKTEYLDDTEQRELWKHQGLLFFLTLFQTNPLPISADTTFKIFSHPFPPLQIPAASQCKTVSSFPAGADTVGVQKFSPCWFEALPSAAHPIQPEPALWRVLKPLRAMSPLVGGSWSKFPSAKRTWNSSDQKFWVFNGGRALLRISQLPKRCLCMKERQSSLRSSQLKQLCTPLL